MTSEVMGRVRPRVSEEEHTKYDIEIKLSKGRVSNLNNSLDVINNHAKEAKSDLGILTQIIFHWSRT